MKFKIKSLWSKWLLGFLSTVVTVVIYYMIFSYFFDTPIEYELKQSSERLSTTLRTMNSRYDSMQMVLRNLEQRDKSIYEIIFEYNPYKTDSTAIEQLAREQTYQGLSNAQLGILFEAKLSSLSQQTALENNSIDTLLRRFYDNQNRINAIPSIQPIDNPKLTLLTSNFGRSIQPFYKTIHYHTGIDYSVAEGTAVFATADGYVQEITTRGSSTGLSMTVVHANGIETFYANLSKTFGQVGSRVARGDVIAFSGNTGLSSAPHLHYEVRKNGKAVNPLSYFFVELDIDQSQRMEQIARRGMQSFD
ncbi:MAG: M23 family metallopeptidase [Mucinivorans sp.]